MALNDATECTAMIGARRLSCPLAVRAVMRVLFCGLCGEVPKAVAVQGDGANLGEDGSTVASGTGWRGWTPGVPWWSPERTRSSRGSA